MRIGLVLEQFDPRRGGLEQWSCRFAGLLAERGLEVHVVAERFGEQTAAMPIAAHRLGPVRSRLAFAEAAQAKLLSLAPDVIHDMGSGWYCDVFHPHGGSWVSLSQRKLLLLPRWLRPLKRGVDRLLPRQRGYQTLLSQQYADNGQILVALSQTTAADFRHFHGVPPERIRIVYNGVDTDHFSPRHRATHREPLRRQLGVDNQTLLALIVAHNFQLKGVSTLLRAMRRLLAEGRKAHLVVVRGKRLVPWRRMARRLGVGAAVSFVGPTDQTAPYYAAADLYVHPTLYDACSLVVLEAAASGLPVITTRLNGVTELLSDGSEALLISDPADVNELAGQMRVLFDGDLREKMGNAGRRMALENTFERNVNGILDVYQEIVRSRGPAYRRKRLARQLTRIR